MSASSPETSLTSSSTSSRDEEELWEESPPSISRLNSMDCWDYTIELECLHGTKDLQLAAELGKTLLERNKELESSLKHHQLVIEDQTQEIEYLTKQTVALREVNDSRLRIYENLEVSILDLERGNHRLAAENSSVKKQNKIFKTTQETLETRCEELTKTIEEITQKLENERRRNERILQERVKPEDTKKIELRPVKSKSPEEAIKATEENAQSAHKDNASESISFALREPNGSSAAATNTVNGDDSIDGQYLELNQNNDKNEELIRLLQESEASRRQLICEQERVAELEEQINALIQENRTLQNRTTDMVNNEEMKSMHDELSILEEVRYGKMCNRCLRNVDDDYPLAEEDVSVAGTDDGDDNTLLETRSAVDITEPHSYRSAVTIKVAPKQDDTQSEISLPIDHSASPNPYRELVEKYEALLEVQRQPIPRNRQPMSLHDELSGDFSSISTKDTGDDFQTKHPENLQGRKPCARTPTDFSEAETSSSGFSDETSNKFTQTDETFLCTIADGEDKFSIYDDASPIDSRFRNRPEYRELFKEIFAILKKAAENKDEGEKLPLLDDSNPCFTVPPVTPAAEELPSFPDETESIVSSVMSEQSVAMSERITRQEKKHILDTVKKHEQENKPPAGGKHVLEDGRVLTPLKREPLEYLAVSVNIRKKKKKSRNPTFDRSDSPILPTPPRVYYTSGGKKRRDLRPISNLANSPGSSTAIWNGTSMTIYNRTLHQSPMSNSTTGSATPTFPSPNTTQMATTPSSTTSTTPSSSNIRTREMPKTLNPARRTSTASQNLHKLIKLDLSYAEVLRRADQHCKYSISHRK